MNRLFHLLMVQGPVTILPDLPRQAKNKFFDSWARQVFFYCAIMEFLSDIVLDLGK